LFLQLVNRPNMKEYLWKSGGTDPHSLRLGIRPGVDGHFHSPGALLWGQIR